MMFYKFTWHIKMSFYIFIMSRNYFHLTWAGSIGNTINPKNLFRDKYVIRRQIVSKALEMWSHQGSIVARSISTCLKLGRPNYSSYKAQIRRLFTKKLENNPYINNILYPQFFIITENLTFPYRVATVNRLQKHDCNSTLSTIR